VGSFHSHSGWGTTVPKPLRLVMILLDSIHLATPHGRVYPFVLIGIDLKAKFLHGWILTTHLINKSTISMEVITIIILCLKIGLGDKQYVVLKPL